MRTIPTFDDLGVERQGHVAIVELRRPPFNYFDLDLISHLLETLRALDDDPSCRAVVLAASGKAFCAGADLGGRGGTPEQFLASARPLYDRAAYLFETRKPIVAAVHGAAIGGGLGLALVADFRVTCESARFAANFARLGVHCGFGLSVTLPRQVGTHAASLMLLTGRRLSGAKAHEVGLADELVPEASVRSTAITLAAEIAAGAPMAVQDMRQTLRQGLGEQVRAATERELQCQVVHAATADHQEGVKAYAERREPVFHDA